MLAEDPPDQKCKDLCHTPLVLKYADAVVNEILNVENELLSDATSKWQSWSKLEQAHAQPPM